MPKKENGKKAAKILGGMSGKAASILGSRGRQLDKMEQQMMGETEKKKKKSDK